MKRICVGGAVLVLAAAVGADLAGQGVASPKPQPYVSSATAILVDVVVRDKSGRPVTDLSAADFDVAEDGVRQKIDSFARVSRGGGIGVGVAWRSPGRTVSVTPGVPAQPSQAADAAPEEATTALVFDHLSAEALRLAQKATLAHVPMAGESNVQVGVFATGPGMRVIQRYTTDGALVRQAVARVLPSGTSAEEQTADRRDELRGRRSALEGQNQAAAAGPAAGTSALAQSGPELGQRETELRLVQTELNMIRSFDNLDRDHRGYDTSLALSAIAQSLSYRPGRKTIIFFSEGLPISPGISATLDAVIDAANRANVTVYAVDAHGLRTKSALTNTRKEMETFAEERFTQLATGTDRTEQPLTMAFERMSDTLTLDSRSGLARLAADTGGFLIEQTNDLASAFRRIDEDTRFHYLLTYSPTNDALDGKFRAIQVKVGRSGVQVFARKGYRPLRTRPVTDAGSYETPALALLNRSPLPNAFPVHAAAFSFPDPARPGLSPVLVQVATGSLRFDVDSRRSTYSAQASIVVRIRDGQDREVQTLSQHYLLSGDAKDLEAATKGEILFYREPDLAPGVYTMESIVFDGTARQGSARVSTLTVPAATLASAGMSSLVLVSRAEELRVSTAAVIDTGGPLYVGRTLLYPNLGEPIRKSAAAQLSFYFALYGDVRGMHATADLMRNGEVLATAPVDLPPATGSRVQHVGRIPVGRLPGGTYELRIQVTGGGRELSRAAYFTLQD